MSFRTEEYPFQKHLTLLPYTHVLLINKPQSTYSLIIYSLLCHGRHQANEAIKSCRDGGDGDDDDDDGDEKYSYREGAGFEG